MIYRFDTKYALKQSSRGDPRFGLIKRENHNIIINCKESETWKESSDSEDSSSSETDEISSLSSISSTGSSNVNGLADKRTDLQKTIKQTKNSLDLIGT